jgi:apolipoprotein N-acyltransferase
VPRSALAAAFPFALGAASVPGYAPLYLFPLPVLALAALAVLWLGARNWLVAAAIGFAFGLGLFLAGASWVYVSLHDFGGMPAAVAAATTLGFCAYLALYPAVVGGLLARAPGPPALKLLLLLPALWAFADWSRGWVFTGFPWLALGYSQVPDSPLAGYAPVFGIYGVSLAAACVAGGLALLYVRDRGRRKLPAMARVASTLADSALWVAVAVLLVGFGLASREWSQPLPGEPTPVALVQGNIPQDLKWRPEKARETLDLYFSLAQGTDAPLVLLPETALPMFNVDLPPGYLDALASRVRARGGDLLTGVPEYAGPGRYFNSVISIGSAPSQTYRKVHLVPFGDYFPLRPVLGWFMNLLDIPMSDFSRGDPEQKPMLAAGQRVAVNICYEDVFGEEIIRQLPEATVLANFTNDAWWGRSWASRQHLQISQMRALESGRMMLRATNTGVTAIIDERGRVSAVAPEFETVVLHGSIRGRSGSTPFVRWGNAAALLLAALMAAVALLAARAARN